MEEDLFFLWVKWLINNGSWKYLLLQSSVMAVSWKVAQPYWDIPWWRINRWENVYDALIREVREETWIQDIHIWWIVCCWLTNIRIPYADTNYWLLLNVFDCSLTTKNDIVVLSNEHSMYKWSECDELLECLAVKYPIDMINSFKTFLRGI